MREELLKNVDTYHAVILHKNWFKNISKGEVAKIPPWVTTHGELHPLIGTREKVNESIGLEPNAPYGTYVSEHTNLKYIGIYMGKKQINDLRKGEIIVTVIEDLGLKIATMTVETYLRSWGNMRLISDEKGFLTTPQPRTNIHLVLPKGGLDRMRHAMNNPPVKKDGIIKRIFYRFKRQEADKVPS